MGAINRGCSLVEKIERVGVKVRVLFVSLHVCVCSSQEACVALGVLED